MREIGGRRRLRVALWLLMPPTVWAASFFGGWIGAAIAESQGSGDTGPTGLVVGGVLGGVVGLTVWLLAVRRLRPPPSLRATRPTPEP